MGVHVIAGGQWGDEGKGKIVDHFSGTADIVARYQGGANAGHTVYIDDRQFILHQIPSGILRPGTRCLLGAGMVVDPVALAQEISSLQDQGIECNTQIGVAYNAHLVLPVHKILDGISEESGQEKTIGTTRRGIGPSYADRYARRGLPVSALLDASAFRHAVESHLKYANKIITNIYDQPAVRFEDFWDTLAAAREVVVPMITDVATELIDALDQNKSIIAEGAQGVLLDIDFGTYPYVTSSHPGSLGVTAGLGIPSQAVTRRTGIFKAYCTRVGEGPFPTEIREPERKERLREAGDEYGATTGRPRRCGWFDAILGRFATRVNGFTEICITKADVLSEFENIKLCTGYQNQQASFLNLHTLKSAQPIYESFPGWTDDISVYDSFSDLPDTLQAYLDVLQSHLQAPIQMISTGPERSQIIAR